MSYKQVTLKELKKIFNQNRLEYYIKKEKSNIVKVHFYVEEVEENE